MKIIVALIVSALPTLAHAHAGTGEGFLRGLLHPLGGADHVAAMLAVGVWAAQHGARAVWLLPATFVAMMAGGGILGAVPFAELGIALSVLVLGALIVGAVRLPLSASAAIVGILALFHGHAHGVEMPADASGTAYGAGFLIATALLHAIGIGIALLMRRIAHGEAWS